MGGEEKDTSRTREAQPLEQHQDQKPTIPGQRSNPGPSGRSALQTREHVDVALWVRARVNWAQREGSRRLAFVLRPLLDRGMPREDLAALLVSWSIGWGRWRPRDPAGYITARLARSGPLDQAPDAEAGDPCGCGCGGRAAGVEPNTEARRVFEAFRSRVSDEDLVPDAVRENPDASRAWREQQGTDIRRVILASFAQADAAAREARVDAMGFGEWLQWREAEDARWWWRRPAEVT